MKIKKILISLFMLLVFSGCGASKLSVLDPVELTERVSSVDLRSSKNTVKIDQKVISKFEAEVREALYGELKFAKGDDIIIQYKFIQFDEGSRAKRYLTGGVGNSGEGSMTVDFTFIKNGKEIGKIQTQGIIGSGFFGGSMDSAISSSVEGLIKYIKSTF